jgi:tetratricopeptide (TPR) repeat protein
LADYYRAIDLDPNLAHAYVNLGVLFWNQRMWKSALTYFEHAARLGDPIGAQNAGMARKMWGMEPVLPVDPAQQVFDAFQEAVSPEAMRQIATRFPLLLEAEFMPTITQVIAEQIPPEQRPAFQQKLAWLRQIAAEQM